MRDDTCGDSGDEREPRATACRALGIDPATIVWPAVQVKAEGDEEGCLSFPRDVARLSDEEWVSISAFLPAEAPQVSAMDNRTFLDAVLCAMQRGGAWTSRTMPSSEIDAVRRRFGRWAHQGIFQALREALPTLAVSPAHQRFLTLAGQRAASLKARGATRKRAHR